MQSSALNLPTDNPSTTSPSSTHSNGSNPDIDSSDYDSPPPTDPASTTHHHQRHHHLPHIRLHRPKHSRSHSRPEVQEIGMSTVADGGGGRSFSGSIQDKVFSKVLQTVVPSDYDIHKYAEMSGKADRRKDRDRPQFSLTLMSGNFRKFNARVGVVFVFQHQLFRVLTWNHTTHTLSAMAVYSFVCLDPRLLAVLPFATILLFVMVPAFIARHPPPPHTSVPQKGGKVEVYNAHGAPVAPPPEVKAVAEISKDFFRNLRDLQNTMADFSDAHDQIIATVGPPTNFSNQQISSGVFQVLFVICCGMFVGAGIVPWNLVFLVWGWCTIALFHPAVQEWLLTAPDSEFAEREKKKAISRFKNWVGRDIVIDETPETRLVEIFELQRHNNDSWEWEPWMYTASPYEPLSPARIAGHRPKGQRFFEDVRPPVGWEWWDKKWVLDLRSREWAAERCVTGVDVEEDKERWVYDVEEVEESDEEAPGRRRRVKRRGEWRRRRWVRGVVRKKLAH